MQGLELTRRAKESTELTRLAPAVRTADTVYGVLRDAIFAGAVAPGSKLSVPSLADQLGVSRSPVREAVLRLTQERLANEQPRRGAVVARIGLDELAALYEVRAVLEGLAARLAVEHAQTGLVDQLTDLLALHERVVEMGDLAAHHEADMTFHSRIRDAAGNHELQGLLEGIQTRVRLGMLTTTVTAGPQKALADHRAILAAIRASDADAAESQAKAHVARLRQALLINSPVKADGVRGAEP